jgi:hypothetical protein
MSSYCASPFRYNARESAPRWQRERDARGIFVTSDCDPRAKNVPETFPYPSGRTISAMSPTTRLAT